jgi:O-antigen ligase
MTSGRIDLASWISTAASAAIPLALGLYWLLYSGNDSQVISMALRVLITGAVAVWALIGFDAPVTRAEIRLSAMLGVFLLLLIVPSVMAMDSVRAFRDLAKLLLMCIIGLGFARALRDRRAARIFGYAMLAGSAMLTAFVIYICVEHVGLSLPTFAELRQMKGMLARKEDLSLNAIGFSAIFMYVIGLCLVRPARWAWWLGGLVFTTAALLTGSRTPGVIVLISAIVLLIVHLIRVRAVFLKAVGWSIALSLAMVAAASLSILSPREMMSLTEGRSALWRVAWDKFTEQPLVGHGLESWRDDISAVPGEFSVSAGAGQIAGGYHNEYMTLLAEGGLVVFLPALAIAFWLLRCSDWVAFRSSVPPSNGYMILFGCVLLILRAAVEVPGLFGYAQEPADYLAYIFLAVVVSQLSIHEDVRRAAIGLRSSIGCSEVRLRVLKEL